MSATVDPTLARDLAGRVSGQVLTPDDDGYHDARQVHNGLIDRHPAVIVRCVSAKDVVAALDFARANRLQVSVRGGGHNVAGRAVGDGVVMIDLARMTQAEVAPEARTIVAGGGLLWAGLNDAAAAHGLAVTGGAISTTGVGGYTLGGGLGWLMGKYGLAADNLVAVELVTASGEIAGESWVDSGGHGRLLGRSGLSSVRPCSRLRRAGRVGRRCVQLRGRCGAPVRRRG